MLDSIGAGATNTQKGVWAEIWQKSEEYQRLTVEIENICTTQAVLDTVGFLDENEYAVPLVTQIAMVTNRTFTSFWRDPDYLLGK
jgi:hypothetical protein